MARQRRSIRLRRWRLPVAHDRSGDSSLRRTCGLRAGGPRRSKRPACPGALTRRSAGRWRQPLPRGRRSVRETTILTQLMPYSDDRHVRPWRRRRAPGGISRRHQTVLRSVGNRGQTGGRPVHPAVTLALGMAGMRKSGSLLRLGLVPAHLASPDIAHSQCFARSLQVLVRAHAAAAARGDGVYPGTGRSSQSP
jgi:hypothetical protein